MTVVDSGPPTIEARRCGMVECLREREECGCQPGVGYVSSNHISIKYYLVLFW